MAGVNIELDKFTMVHCPEYNLKEKLTQTQQALDRAVEALKECLGDYKMAYDAMRTVELMQPTHARRINRNISLEQAGLRIQVLQAAIEEAALASIKE